MRYVKAAIVFVITGSIVFMCFWPMYDEIDWLSKLVDPAVQPMLNVLGGFALIIMISVIFIIFLG